MSELGDTVELQKQSVKVVGCDDCSYLMVNIDADQVAEGDLLTLKRLGLRLSNPETKEEICLNCEVPKRQNFRDKVNDWFNTPSKDDDDDDDTDSGFFSGGVFGGSSSGGGFGGFGGGSFSGGGASRGF